MPIINRIAEFHREMTEWRQDLHAHPELALQETRTSGVVQAKLQEFGVDEIITGLARTGVVGVIRGNGRRSARSACAPTWMRCRSWRRPAHPMPRRTLASCMPAAMTVTPPCCSARRSTWPRRATSTARSTSSSSRRRKTSRAATIMVKEGLFERCEMEMVFGMHNWPQMPAGTFAWRNGPVMAAVANIEITITGKGAHAAQPHFGTDPIVVASHIVTALQTIVSRTIEPVESGVVTIGHINGGDTYNVIPETVRMLGTARWFDARVGDQLENGVRAARLRHSGQLRRQGRCGVQSRLSGNGERP